MPDTPVPRRLVYAKEASLTRTDTTATYLFTLPRGAIPLQVTIFTAATAAGGTIDVGITGDTDLYVDGGNVAVLGSTVMTLLDVTERPGRTDVYALIGGAPGAGGPFTVTLEYTSIRTTRVV